MHFLRSLRSLLCLRELNSGVFRNDLLDHLLWVSHSVPELLVIRVHGVSQSQVLSLSMLVWVEDSLFSTNQHYFRMIVEDELHTFIGQSHHYSVFCYFISLHDWAFLFVTIELWVVRISTLKFFFKSFHDSDFLFYFFWIVVISVILSYILHFTHTISLLAYILELVLMRKLIYLRLVIKEGSKTSIWEQIAKSILLSHINVGLYKNYLSGLAFHSVWMV